MPSPDTSLKADPMPDAFRSWWFALSGSRSILLCPLLLISTALHAGTPGPGESDFNQVPNAFLHGTAGATLGSVTGPAPSLWRAFATGGGALTTEIVALPANELFPGSPPTNAIKLTVTAFGTDQGLDHTFDKFSILPGRTYAATVYLRSGNADSSSQMVNVGFGLFSDLSTFNGRAPGSFGVVVNSSWQAYTGPDFLAIPGDAFGQVAVRLGTDGGEDSVWVALPEVHSQPQANEAPNPVFAGTGGTAIGDVTGTVPNQWRAFAVDTGSIDVSVVAVAAGELFPGSPATQAVRLEVLNGNGATEGFDHEISRPVLVAGHAYRGEVWLRSGNGGGAQQGVSMGMPIFNSDGSFTGTAPGSAQHAVGADWSLYGGPSFVAEAGQTSNLGFRLTADGGDDILLIALPRIVGPASPQIYSDGFEAQ